MADHEAWRQSQRIRAGSEGCPAVPVESDASGALSVSSCSRIDARLLVWLSPAFPVGAFAFSHGLELAAERGWLHDRAGLEAWIGDLAERGSLRTDLVLLAAAWRAAWRADADALRAANELALALQPSAERRLESATQGNAFMATIAAAWPCADIAAAQKALAGEAAYPVAVGAVAAAHGCDGRGTLAAYAIAFASNLASAAIRLGVVGQTDAQRVIAALMPALERQAANAEATTLDDVGSGTYRSDLASLAHETQYSRLFRS